MRIIGYVIRGVRLLAAPWRARGHSIWHLKVCHKGSVALFRVFEHFFVLASHCFFHWLDQAHLGGWVGRRRCPPRSRVRSGPAGLGPRVGCLSGHSDVFCARLTRDTIKVTVRYRLMNHWMRQTIVDAGRRLFGAIIYLPALSKI